MADDGTGDPKADKFAIGYVHNLSKRTALYTSVAGALGAIASRVFLGLGALACGTGVAKAGWRGVFHPAIGRKRRADHFVAGQRAGPIRTVQLGAVDDKDFGFGHRNNLMPHCRSCGKL